MRFKLVRGTHKEGVRTYQKGDIVESDAMLDSIFVNKFKRLHSDEEPDKPVQHQEPVAKAVPEEEATSGEKQAADAQETLEKPAVKKPAKPKIKKPAAKRTRKRTTKKA